MTKTIHETTITIHQLLNSCRPSLFKNGKVRDALSKKYEGRKNEVVKVTIEATNE